MDSIDRLPREAARLAELDAERARLVAVRDKLIVNALYFEAATWAQVEQATGLNRSAIAKAIRRHQSVGNRPTASARRSSPTPT